MRIALFGTVGAGKSTISEEISQKLGYQIFPEPIADNPYFDEYYNDMEKFAFKMQIYMLLARSKQLNQAYKKDNIIFDRTILEDPIFVDVLHNVKAMNDTDYSVFTDFFDEVIIPSLGDRAKFDIIIYLRVDTQKAIERIKTRGREQELETSFEYWDNLNQMYEKAYNKRKKMFNFLVVDANTDDLSKKVNEIIESLENIK